MNTEPITVRYKFDKCQSDVIASDLIRANRFLRISPWLGWLVIIIGVVCFIWQTKLQQKIPYILPIFLGMGLLSERAISKWKFRRNFKKNSVYDRSLVWHVTENKLECDSSDAFRSELSWVMIIKSFETSNGFFLYTGNSVFYWFPIVGFEDSSKVEVFRHLLKSHVVNYKYCGRAIKK